MFRNGKDGEYKLLQSPATMLNPREAMPLYAKTVIHSHLNHL